MTDTSRYICIHGHFYQPPRENPWLDVIEPQPSAAPFRDWNERVTAECYRPNGYARILGEQGRVRAIRNNYADISFNFGPTLLAWLRRHAPETWNRLRAGDEQSQRLRNGHGNALAQVYNHVIMPLATPRDRELQVAWGKADFRSHFGRDPEGMWLAECAVDVPTLESLAEGGIRFTVLAPRQARAVCPLDGNGQPTGEWRTVGEAIDPTRPYRCDLPSGRTIVLFFYDGPISQAVAFERLLDSGAAFADRLTGGFSDSRAHTQLMHIATDGESYGHHHRYGEMALAAAIDDLRGRGITVTNYGEFLEQHPPQMAVRIAEPSAWSCVHGVERWRDDCGCRMSKDFHQQWRRPFRETLEWLRDVADERFESVGSEIFRNPWHARLDYIDLILDPDPGKASEWLDLRLRTPVSGEETRTRAMQLLEMQRHAQLMFTSCGWFFDEVSGLESVQNMRYAARVAELAARFGPDVRGELVDRLDGIPSNLDRFGNGRAIWDHHVSRTVVTPLKVAAHVVVNRLFDDDDDDPGHLSDSAIDVNGATTGPVYTHVVEEFTAGHLGGSRQRLVVGRLRSRDHLTGEPHDTEFALLDFGNLDFHCAVQRITDDDAFAAARRDLFDTFSESSLTSVIRRMDHHFCDGEFYSLADLFHDMRQHVLEQSTRESLTRVHGVYHRVYEDNRRLLEFSRRLDLPVPPALEVAVGYVLASQLQGVMLESAPIGRHSSSNRLERLIGLLEEARRHGVHLPPMRLADRWTREIEHGIASLGDRHHEGPDLARLLDRLLQLITELDDSDVRWDRWRVQNALCQRLNADDPDSLLVRLQALPRGEVRDRALGCLQGLVEALGFDPAITRLPAADPVNAT